MAVTAQSLAAELAKDNAAWATATPVQRNQMQSKYQGMLAEQKQATQNTQMNTAANEVVADLNADKFSDAWSTALSTSSLYGTNYNAPTNDPLLAALESSTGLNELDPGKQWTSQEVSQFYSALGENPVYQGKAVKGIGGGNESLGKNPYGTWGSGGAVTGGSDAAANIAQEGATPDVERFAGAKPTKSFLGKYGADIATLALAVAAPEAIPAIEAAVGGSGVLGAVEAGAIYGAGAGAVRSVVSGGNALKDIGVGAAIGGAAGGVGAEVSSLGGNAVERGIATSLTRSGLTAAAGSTLTSPSGKGTAALSPGVAPIGASVAGPPATTGFDDPRPTTFLGGLEQGLGSSLGGDGGNIAGTIGSTLGSIAPYAAVAGIGEAQASTGEAQAQKYSQEQQNLAQPSITQSNTLLGKYNTGQIDPLTKALSSTEIAQGSSLLNAPTTTGLSAIANQAFSGYLTGALQPAQQKQLDEQVSSQKQAVAAQLAAAGITDSSVLQGQYQQIDDQALITKQNMINSNFQTGVSAYDQWLQTTTEGQQTIQAGMTVASNALQTELQNSMQEAGIGIGEMNTAISTQMQTDAEYANQVSTLLGTLATAYARQQAGQKTGSSGGVAIPKIGGSGAGAASSALGSAVTAGEIAGLTSGARGGNAQDISSAGNAELGNLTEPPGGWLSDSQLGNQSGSGSVPYVTMDGQNYDSETGELIGPDTADAITGSSSSWLSDLGGGSYYG